MLFVEEGVLAQDDLQAMGLFELTYEFSKRALKVMRNCRVDHEGNLLVDICRGDSEQLTTDLETDSRQRLYSARSMTVGALSAEGAFQARAGALAGQLDQADVAHRQKLRSGGVAGEFLGQGVKDQLSVFGLFHVDEIDNDDSTEVAKS